MKIGYQGIAGCNSEAAAKVFQERLGFDSVEFVPLGNSSRAIKALEAGKVTYAVMAVQNSIGGPVTESIEALSGTPVKEVDRLTMDIHHFLFGLAGEKIRDIRCIASHEQALKQTEKTRQQLFSSCDALSLEDTASAARDLAKGKLPKGTAVLCRENAGHIYGLELLLKNLEDDPKNLTDFSIYKNV